MSRTVTSAAQRMREMLDLGKNSPLSTPPVGPKEENAAQRVKKRNAHEAPRDDGDLLKSLGIEPITCVFD